MRPTTIANEPAKRRRQARTLLEVCVARAAEVSGDSGSMWGELKAVPKGMRVCEYVIEFAIAIADGAEPTVRDVAARWREPERTMYRRNAEFKELFPDEATPARIAIEIARRARGDRDVKKLAELRIAV